MINMQKCANIFQTKNRGKGTVSKVNDYSFTWTTIPTTKDGKTETKVYYASYFLWNKEYE